MKVAMTIAGSDSSGGAGIQADLKTFAAIGVHGASAVAAVTAQNTERVVEARALPAEWVATQIDAVLDDLPVAAVKTGMLGDAEVVRAVAAALARRRVPNRVVDPVLVSSSGTPLLADGALEVLRRDLLPLATVLTPNLPEAAALAGMSVETPAQIEEAARRLAGLGATWVVIKGGHAPGRRVVDVVFDGSTFHRIDGPRLETRSTHGTGCTLSAAIAAWLARGAAPLDAVARARRYLEGALAAARPLGRGRGPLHHMHPYYPWEGA